MTAPHGVGMATYRVERVGSVREVYLVEAESPEDAERNWVDGELICSEVGDTEPYSVRLEDD